MSRIAKKPIIIPSNVQVTIDETQARVKGPKGELVQALHPYVSFELQGNELWIKPNTTTIKRKSEMSKVSAMMGTYWRLVNNMIIGVTQGFTKELEIVGVGYRAQLQGNKIVMSLGYAHPVEVDIPSNLKVEVPSPNKIIVSGIDKQVVGQYAANIRKWREPNAYSGKGIRYVGEVIRLKEGKKA